MAFTIRPVRPDEYERLGAITRDTYMGLPGHPSEPEYEAELADVRGRAELPGVTVFVAVDDGGTVLGGATFVADHESELAEHGVEGAASMRMLAVDPAAQGRGIGSALTRQCIEAARDAGAHALVMHSGAWMHTAHRLYERLGFVRDPDLDWVPQPDVELLCYRLTL